MKYKKEPSSLTFVMNDENVQFSVVIRILQSVMLQAVRKIPRIPFKVLDAPELQDDFYLNLVDWSSQNILSVGLGSCVYLWSACTSQVSA